MRKFFALFLLASYVGGNSNAPTPAGPAVGTAVLTQIEDALIEHLGPMDSLIWREQLEAAAKQIGDPGKIQRFKEQALKLLKSG